MTVVAAGASLCMVLATPQPAEAQFGAVGGLLGLGTPAAGSGQQSGAADPAKEIEAIEAELGIIKTFEQKQRNMIAIAERALIDAQAVQGVALAATRNVHSLVGELKAGKTQIEASASDLMQKIDAVSTAQKVQHANIQKAKSRAVDAADAEEKSGAIGDTLDDMGSINIAPDAGEEVSNIEKRKLDVEAAQKSFDSVYAPMAVGTAEAKAQFVSSVVLPVATRMGAAQSALRGSLDMMPKINRNLDLIDKEFASVMPSILESGGKVVIEKGPALYERGRKVLSGLSGMGANLETANKVKGIMSLIEKVVSTVKRHNELMGKVNSTLQSVSSVTKGSEPVFRNSVQESEQILKTIRSVGVKAMSS
ncbi:MAG: hypothetical protein HQL33_01920 [Alphaproteobacteria bacterium]|nr:hypothetical protein [Alphaproteobacteria bacterium]